MSNARDIADAGHQLVAWVNFDGGQVTNPNPLMTGVRKSFGVSSVLDEGQGAYAVYFENEMPDDDYCVVLGQNIFTNTTGSKTVIYGSHANQHFNTTFFQIKSGTISTGTVGSSVDSVAVTAAVFR